jgi:hypothetical protein
MYRELSWLIRTRDSSIYWNIDNVWAAGEGIISAEVNTTAPMTVYILR